MITGNPIAETYDHRATQLSAEAEIAVGRIAIWASLLERNLGELAQRLSRFSLSDPPSPGSRAISEARTLIRTSGALSAADAAEVLKVLDESGRLLKTRNTVIHAVVGTSMKPGAATFRNHPKDSDRILSDEDLDQIAKDLHGTAWEVFDCSMTVARTMGKLKSAD